tara:strand:+ start:381 stop:605 length:225 start_codon:yes stop_codon:yes gene_type:complete
MKYVLDRLSFTVLTPILYLVVVVIAPIYLTGRFFWDLKFNYKDILFWLEDWKEDFTKVFTLSGKMSEEVKHWKE